MTILDKVILVEQNEKYGHNGLKQVYFVDPANKKSLESAIEWGTTWVKDPNNPNAKGPNGMIEKPPRQLLLPNGHFHLALYSSPGNSSQSGKLSFCRCVLEYQNERWLIGISTEYLIKLLQDSTCINGKINGDVYLFRDTNVGAISATSEHCKQLLARQSYLAQSKKTTKPHIGFEYITQTDSDVLLAETWHWIRSLTYAERIANKFDYHADHYMLMNTPIKHYTYYPTSKLNEYYPGLTKASEIYKQTLVHLAGKQYFPGLHTFDHIAKLPSRVLAGQRIQDDVGKPGLQQYLDQLGPIGVTVNASHLDAVLGISATDSKELCPTPKYIHDMLSKTEIPIVVHIESTGSEIYSRGYEQNNN